MIRIGKIAIAVLFLECQFPQQTIKIGNKLVIRRVQRRGTTCRFYKRGNLTFEQVVSTLFFCLFEKLITKYFIHFLNFNFMTTKTITKICLLAALGLASAVFTSCKDDEPTPNNSNGGGGNQTNTPTTDVGVVINGVKWATRNVDDFGTFAATPESSGMFYQWNRPKAWAATGTVTDWDSDIPTGTTWGKANDPSPKGWRVPTKAEMDKLCDETKVSNEWTTQNGVKGRKFTDKSTGASVFLPAAGLRSPYYKGTLYSAGTSGYYWSSTRGSTDYYAYFLKFHKDAEGDDAFVGYDSRTNGLSVRSVAE